MDDVISKLTAEQALKIVERLGRKGGKLRKAVLTETMNVLTEIDLDETADEVFTLLESIDVQDCWDRSGSSRYDYTSPDEAAAEMIEEELQPSSIKSDDIMNWGSQSRKQLIGWASSSEFIAMSGRRSRSSGNGPRIFQPSWWLPAGQVARTKSRWAPHQCDARVYSGALPRVGQMAERRSKRSTAIPRTTAVRDNPRAVVHFVAQP